MNTLKVSRDRVIEVIENFFDKENDRIAKEHHAYLLEQSTKRRFFWFACKPKEVDWSFVPTIGHSMAFQHMWPHHEAKSLLDCVKIAKNPNTLFTVDTRLWAEVNKETKKYETKV